MIASANELRYFLELSQTLNFSRASERIGITQSSLSTAIKRLEHLVGTELFIRDKHKVILTQAGQNLLTHTRQLLQLWDTVKSSCLSSQVEVQGNVILGCHPSIALYFLPRFLPKLLAEHPKLEVKLKHDLSRKVAEEVINFSIDVGIVVNPIKHPDLIIKKLFNDEISCWSSNKLAKKGIDDKIIICDPDLRQTQFILKKMHQKNIKYKKTITTNNLEVIARLTAEGAGIGILPGRVVKALQQSKLHRVPSTPIYQDEICLVYRHENRNLKSVQVMLEAIKTS